MIKTEPTFFVKVEEENEQLEIRQRIAIENQTMNNAESKKLNAEKAQLVCDLIDLREEYDRVCDKLNEKDTALENIKDNFNQMVEQKDSEINKLQMEAKKLREKFIKANKNGVYDVEQILKHKMIGSEWNYLIRWEHFGPEFDTWEPQRNLFCTNMLSKYMKKHNLN